MPTISMRSNSTLWRGRIDWSYTQNISKNTSTIHAEVVTWKDDNMPSSAPSGAPFKGRLSIGDEYVDFSYLQQNVASEKSPQWIAELDVTVKHASDGTCSVVISCSIDAPTGVSMDKNPLEGEEVCVLDPIGGASKIYSVSNVDLGEACRVVWTPASSSFYYKIKFAYGTWDETTEPIHPNTTSSFSYTNYALPIDLANEITSAQSATISVSLYSYRDSACKNQVGSTSTSSFTATVPESVKPVIDSVSIRLINDPDSPISDWGVALAGYSKLGVTASASESYGASIKSYTISGTYSTTIYSSTLDYSGDVVRTSGNKKLIVSCTDSRGRTSDGVETDIISFLPYVKPTADTINVSRSTFETDDISDDRMIVTATWSYDSVGGHNEVTAQVQYKETTASEWTTHPGNLTHGEPFTVERLNLDGDNEYKSYNFRVVVTDTVGNSSCKEAFAASTTVLLDFKAGGDGLGIGKICEQPGLEVSMPATFFNEMYVGDRDTTLSDYIKENQNQPLTTEHVVNLIYPVGSIYISTEEVNPSNLFGGSWEQLTGRFLLGAGTIGENTDDHFGDINNPEWSVDPGTKGGQDYNTLTVEEMPAHSHFGVRRNATDNSGTHSVGSGAGDNSASGRTDSEGLGKAHNNMPPYLAVYMWKRIS